MTPNIFFYMSSQTQNAHIKRRIKTIEMQQAMSHSAKGVKFSGILTVKNYVKSKIIKNLNILRNTAFLSLEL